MIPNACHRVIVLFITICLWWLGCGPKAVRQESDWADLNHQVEALYAQSHYARAVPMADKALPVSKTQYGPDHPVVATSFNYLKVQNKSQGRYADAEPLHEQALKMR